MKNSSPNGASIWTCGRPIARCVLTLLIPGTLASVACSTTEAGGGDGAAAAGSTTDGTGGMEVGGEFPGATAANSGEGSGEATAIAPGPGVTNADGTGDTGGNSAGGAASVSGGDTGSGGVGTSDLGADGSSNAETTVTDSASGSITNAGDGSAVDAGSDGVTSDEDSNATNTSDDGVTRTASTFTFRHFPIETNSDDVWSGAMSPGVEPTSTTFDTVILENGYLRVTLLPDYGGRILSIMYKPTNSELLYQNPLGTPYLMYEDIFYYDYLVIMGGIFPSFPEPEHGRYWNQPYDFEVISEGEDAITVRMSRQDDREVVDGVPEVYDVGRTDVLVEVDVTLRAGSTRLELDTKLTNTRSSVVPEFEYWTVTTLAPGSTPGETAIPINTRIMAAMERVHLLESSWSWFGDAEERVTDEIFTWNNLSYFENWVDQGTAFANPEYSANWSGLVNYNNDVGVLRVSDNTETPGLKVWTFGRDSVDIDINDSAEWLRPTIELWHGVTPEFWNRGTMAANEVRQWSESYFPTLGLKEITAANEHGALSLSSAPSGVDTTLSAAGTLTLPEQAVTAVLRLNGDIILEQEMVVATTEATSVSVTVASSDATPGALFEAEFRRGDISLLSGQITLE